MPLPVTGTLSLSQIITEFEGGDFCIFHRGPLNLGGVSAGTALCIPSYVNHRVTPVTKGTRYVLVLFVLGPIIR